MWSQDPGESCQNGLSARLNAFEMFKVRFEEGKEQKKREGLLSSVTFTNAFIDRNGKIQAEDVKYIEILSSKAKGRIKRGWFIAGC